MFQRQFTLTAKEKNNVKELALFMSLIYIRFWLEAPHTGKSSFNDVQLLQALENYPNRTIVKAATSTFCRHLCFSLKFWWDFLSLVT